MDGRVGAWPELTMKHQQHKPWAFFASSRATATVLLHHCGIDHIDNPSIGHGDQQN
jgi:hypothetical protein